MLWQGIPILIVPPSPQRAEGRGIVKVYHLYMNLTGEVREIIMGKKSTIIGITDINAITSAN